MNRIRVLGGAAALTGLALLAAAPAMAVDTTPAPTISASPSPSATAPDGPPLAPPVAAVPRAVALTGSVSQRVAPPGRSILASGRTSCSRVHVVVDGQPTGWDAGPPRYFDRTRTVVDSAWHAAFPMPSEVSTVTVTCLDAGSTESWETTVAPLENPGHTTLVTTSRDGRLSLRLILVDQPQPPVLLLTDQGRAVSYTLAADGRLLFRRPVGAASVVVIGWHNFGENAGAQYTGAQVSFTARLPLVASPSPAPSVTTTTSGDGLAPSGGPGLLLPIALLLLAGGTALVVRRPV